ncbi:MAG TPA: hypothetical protein V6D23_16635 [Candidatus Obscuribacterales bacterium]
MKNLSAWLCIWAIWLLCRAGPVAAKTSFYLEAQGFFTGQKAQAQLCAYLEHEFLPEWGLFSWGQVNDDWAEMYVGPYYRPLPWLTLGLGAGVEQADVPWRIGASVFINYESFFFMHISEYGGSGYWYRFLGTYALPYGFRLGINAFRYGGVGPYAEYTVPGLDAVLAVSPLYDFESNSGSLFISLGKYFGTE